MAYIDGSADPDDLHHGDRKRTRKDKEGADEVARQVFFTGNSTYSGSPAALARLRARGTRH